MRDLQGNPYKFYRGKGYERISVGRYFCSCFDIAKSYRMNDDTPIIEAEIVVRKPLVIDATIKNGHSDYNSLCIHDCKLYPEKKRKSLVRYIQEVGGRDTLSTDEVLKWAMRTKDIDAVIIKNVREGNNEAFPIYDVMIWNEENLLNARNVVSEVDSYESFSENTLKRVDLSAYIYEEERDGIVSVKECEGYFIENTMTRRDTKWSMGHEVVVNTEVPVDIFWLDAGKYITVTQLDRGIYEKSFNSTSERTVYPHNGVVRIKGMMLNGRYRIENQL